MNAIAPKDIGSSASFLTSCQSCIGFAGVRMGSWDVFLARSRNTTALISTLFTSGSSALFLILGVARGARVGGAYPGVARGARVGGAYPRNFFAHPRKVDSIEVLDTVY
ncbi:hypothetical protein EVAR_62407_1 [Eumeta japonica]|uniref:Uncharacterized protein n=1 Tax=Eumeta variegata TaxID=151549 RepID=A0A4C1ZBJ1_EUMVA|nr:hypothetical protein EVAR_62407_1 [Eumeta japonica]